MVKSRNLGIPWVLSLELSVPGTGDLSLVGRGSGDF